MPLLGPGAAGLRDLNRMPVSILRQAADQRRLAIQARATRNQIANQLVQYTIHEQGEVLYKATGVAFDSREPAYPHVRRLVSPYHPRHILDVGTGPGLFADVLRRTRTLPPDGSYIGFDVSPTAIELAKKRVEGDPRFTFYIGDASRFDEPPDRDIDTVMLTFILSYLDTHAAHRLIHTVASTYPDATVVTALTFRSCADLLESVEPDQAAELRAARRYIKGDTAGAEKRWDLRRLLHYRQSLETYYRVVEQRTLSPMAQTLEVWLPKRSPARRRSARKPSRT
jgi:SAM-dependent methyltransferase